MSADLYATRLFWNGRSGIAKCDGVTVTLSACPLGKTISEVDYAPDVRVAQIRESAQGWRDMTKAERDAADDQLTRCAAAARSML